MLGLPSKGWRLTKYGLTFLWILWKESRGKNVLAFVVDLFSKASCYLFNEESLTLQLVLLIFFDNICKLHALPKSIVSYKNMTSILPVPFGLDCFGWVEISFRFHLPIMHKHRVELRLWIELRCIFNALLVIILGNGSIGWLDIVII